jgi:pimeloyl-ACP methyl ester carboxylesterase
VSTYVLVHGSYHGGWCWEKVVPLLRRSGHDALAPDLPTHGEDGTPVSEASLDGYAEHVCGVLDSLPEPAILVGHSMAGAVISRVAELRPDAIEALVYLCGYLLRAGESMRQVSEADDEGLLMPNMVVAPDRGTVSILPDAARDVFYGDCSEEDAGRAGARLRPAPVAPLLTPMGVTKENFGRVPRVYVETALDRAISPAAQRRMHTALPCRKVVTMETGHSPFYAAPEALVAELVSL